MKHNWILDVGEEADKLDIYDENRNWLGVEKRKIVHDNGYWHYAIHCWVFFESNGARYLIFQKRNANKRLFPLKYDVAAAGHYVAGEYGDVGLREVAEELKLPKGSFRSTFYKTIRCTYKDDFIINNEFCNVYLCQILDIDQLKKFDKTELEDVIIVKAADCLDLLNGTVPSVRVYSICQKAEIDFDRGEFVQEYLEYFTDIAKVLEAGSFCMTPGKQYTFVMLKPDAIERGYVSKIVRFLSDAGFSIEMINVKYASEAEIFEHYKEKILEEGDIYKLKASKYFNGKLVIPMVLSHDSRDAISIARKIIGFRDPSMAEKDTIRGRWGIDSMQQADSDIRCCENLIHASDSPESFAREILIWFERNEVERYIQLW